VTGQASEQRRRAEGLAGGGRRHAEGLASGAADATWIRDGLTGPVMGLAGLSRVFLFLFLFD